MAYVTKTELAKRRADVENLGYTDAEWTELITRAERTMNRALDLSWYRAEAVNRGLDWQNTPFASDQVITTAQVQDAAAYLTLSLAYEKLMSAREADAHARLQKHFAERYQAELRALLDAGLDYDWDDDSTLDNEERSNTRYSTKLVRR